MKTKNNLKKRIMSFALVMCMVAAFIPAMPAEYAQAAGETITYDFTGIGTSTKMIVGSTIDSEDSAKYDSFKDIADLVAASTTNSGNGSWYVSDASITNPGSNSFIRVHSSYIQQKLWDGATGSVKIGITVDETGYYDASTGIAVYQDGQGKQDLTWPVTITVAGKENEISFKESTKETATALGVYYLEAGTEYTVVYSMTATVTQHLLMYNLKLTPVTSELVVNDETLPTAMSIGDSADLPTVVHKVGTETYPVNVNFTSSKDDVISIDNGKLTANAAGYALLTATDANDAETVYGYWGIVVREAATAGEISYRMDGQIHASNKDKKYLRDLASGTEYTDSVYETTWTYEGYVSVVTTHEMRSDNGLGLKMKSSEEGNVEDEGTITIKLNVEKAGLYSVAANVAINDTKTTSVKFTIKDSDSEVLLSKDLEKGAVTSEETVLGTVNFTESGWYTVEFYAHTSGSKLSTVWNWLKAITLTERTVTANGIFGSKYAYIEKEDNETYTLNFVGGLNDINYAKVGFEINGDVQGDEYTTAVYDSLKVNGEVYSASHYEAEHVFCVEKTGFAPGATVTIKPYVEDADGKRTYHKYSETEEEVEFTFTLPNANA